MCVGFLYTVDVSIPSLSLFNKQSKKGSLHKLKVFIRKLPVKAWERQVISLKHASSVANKHKMESLSANHINMQK